MARLGYKRYAAQGGDWGAVVTMCLGIQDSSNCLGVHVNMPIAPPDPSAPDLTEQEKSALASIKYYDDWDSGYSKQQSTRPQTLGYALCDSPVGQMAWILEKFWSWTDCNGHPENVLTRDELLDNVMLYWLTGTALHSNNPRHLCARYAIASGKLDKWGDERANTHPRHTAFSPYESESLDLTPSWC